MLKSSKTTNQTQELDMLYYLIGLAAALTAAVIEQGTLCYKIKKEDISKQFTFF